MDWLNAAALFILVAGHTELLVTIINRLHGLPIRADILQHARHVHDLLLLAFPPALIGFVGLSGPGLLFGGDWSGLPIGWRLYLSACAAGAVGLSYSILRHQLRRPPAQLLSVQSQVIDVAAAAGRQPIGSGPFRSLLRLPGNQQFQVEVTQKELLLPRLPVEQDGLTILHLSDWHFFGAVDRPYFEFVAELARQQPADIIVFTGDLLDRQELTQWIPTTLGRLSAPLGCLFVLGNHDWSLDPEPIRTALREHGWQDVSGRVLDIPCSGPRLLIGGTERPWMGTHPDFGAAPATGTARPLRILLSHGPDCIAAARRRDVDLMLAGHNHGGQVVLPIIGPVYSPSITGCHYAGGTFWRAPTLMHVSRGLSGRHPLRIDCPPEITRLILRSPASPPNCD